MSKRGLLVYETVTKFLHGKLNHVEAAELMQVLERTIARLALTIEAKGFMGVIHGN